MPKLTAVEKRDLFKAMRKEGYDKDAIQMAIAGMGLDTLRAMLVKARSGKPVAGRPGPPKGHLGAVAKAMKEESKEFLSSPEGKMLASRAGMDKDKGTVLFSFKIGAKELERLRAISEDEGESVSLLIRQAVKAYLSARGDE